MDAPIGTIIAYATAPGTTASDGTGINGLYTASLIKYITKPELSIEDVFKQVRVDVVSQSNRLQTPWESTSLMGDFYFYHDDLSKVYQEDEIKQDVSKSSRSNKPKQESINHHTVLLELVGLKYHYEFLRGPGIYVGYQYRLKYLIFPYPPEYYQNFQTIDAGISYRIGKTIRPYVGAALTIRQIAVGYESFRGSTGGAEFGILFSSNRFMFDLGVLIDLAQEDYIMPNIGIGYRF